jgi:hypothetical protein
MAQGNLSPFTPSTVDTCDALFTHIVKKKRKRAPTRPPNLPPQILFWVPFSPFKILTSMCYEFSQGTCPIRETKWDPSCVRTHTVVSVFCSSSRYRWRPILIEWKKSLAARLSRTPHMYYLFVMIVRKKRHISWYTCIASRRRQELDEMKERLQKKSHHYRRQLRPKYEIYFCG